MANGKTQKEYYGYKPPKPFDWVTASEKALGQIEGVIEGRVKERADNETTRRETSKTLERLEQGQNKDFNEVVTDGSFMSKDWAYDLTQKLYNNEINSKEYRLAMNNLQDGWTNFSDISKGFNEKLQLFDESDGSIVQSAAEKEFADMANFRQKKIEIGPNGKVYWAMLDDNGKVIPGKTQSMTAINKTPQQLHERVHLTKEVSEYDKELGEFKKIKTASGAYKEGGVLAMEQFNEVMGSNISNWQNWVNSVTAQMLDDPNQAASVLGDNSTYGDDYQTYFTYDEDDLVDPSDLTQGFKSDSEYADEDPLSVTAIKLIRDGNGQYKAELTDDQMKQARIVVENEMRSQVGIEQIPYPKFTNTKNKPSLSQTQTTEGYIDTLVLSAAAATLNDVSQLENRVISATKQMRNVRISGGNIYYDNYHPNGTVQKRNEVIALEGLTSGDARYKKVFDVLSGKTGADADKAYKDATSNLSSYSSQEQKITDYQTNAKDFTEVPLVKLGDRSNVRVRKDVYSEKSSGTTYTCPTVTVGWQNPEDLMKEFSNTTNWDKIWAGDFKDFLEDIVTSGSGTKIKSRISVDEANKTAKIKVGSIEYKVSLTGDAAADLTNLEEILEKIQKVDYAVRRGTYVK